MRDQLLNFAIVGGGREHSERLLRDSSNVF